jgi:hypothetical protein
VHKDALVWIQIRTPSIRRGFAPGEKLEGVEVEEFGKHREQLVNLLDDALHVAEPLAPDQPLAGDIRPRGGMSDGRPSEG